VAIEKGHNNTIYIPLWKHVERTSQATHGIVFVVKRYSKPPCGAQSLESLSRTPSIHVGCFIKQRCNAGIQVYDSSLIGPTAYYVSFLSFGGRKNSLGSSFF